MPAITRRRLLAGAAVGTAGALTTAFGGDVFAATPPGPTPDRPGLGPRSFSAPTPGVTYKTYVGSHFKPTGTGVDLVYDGNGSVNLSGATAFVDHRLDAPQGSVIKEAQFNLLMNDTNGASVIIDVFDGAGGISTFLIASTNTTPNPSLQTLSIVTGLPITVNNNTFTYNLRWAPGSASANQILYGARVGYILNPGIFTFPSGHRVWDGYTTPVSTGNVYGPITALTEVSTSGWTGQPTGVPAGAKAAWCAVQAYSPGVLTLFPDGAPDPGGANYAGTGPNGQLNLLYMLVPLSAAGKFAIHAYFTGQVFVDVWGYQV